MNLLKASHAICAGTVLWCSLAAADELVCGWVNPELVAIRFSSYPSSVRVEILTPARVGRYKLRKTVVWFRLPNADGEMSEFAIYPKTIRTRNEIEVTMDVWRAPDARIHYSATYRSRSCGLYLTVDIEPTPETYTVNKYAGTEADVKVGSGSSKRQD